MLIPRLYWRISILGLWLFAGCALTTAETSIPPGSTLTLSPIPSHITEVSTTWEVIAPGLERRVYLPDSAPALQIMALRIDPTLYTFRVHYRPGEPLTAQGWRDALPEATAFVNAKSVFPKTNRS